MAMARLRSPLNRGLRALTAAVSLAILGCQSERGGRTSIDQSGGEAPARRLQVSETPIFAVTGGALPSGDSLPFFRILHGAFVDDLIVIALGGGENRLVFLDRSGEVVHVHGRAGAGPGEFRQITGLHSTEGGAAVLDRMNARATRVNARAEGVEYALPPAVREHRSVGVFTDGTLVTTHGPGLVTDSDAAQLERLGLLPGEGRPRPYAFWSPDGALVGVISGAPEPPRSSYRLEFELNGGEVTSSFSPLPGCLSRPLEAVVGDVLLVVDDRSGSVHSIDRVGHATELVTTLHRATATEAGVRDVEGWIERTSRDFAGRGARGPTEASIRAVRARAGRPGDALGPAWSRIIPDDGGDGMWLERARCYSAESMTTWDVHSNQGDLIGMVELPATFRVLGVKQDLVLGVRTDVLGIEVVQLLRVER